MKPELLRLARLRGRLEYLQELLPLTVAEARAAGASWQQIGEALGMTKQSAHKRFAGDRPDIEQLPLSDPVFDVLFQAPNE